MYAFFYVFNDKIFNNCSMRLLECVNVTIDVFEGQNVMTSKSSRASCLDNQWVGQLL